MREFRAHETAWVQELDGLRLADFWQRAGALAVDALLALSSLLVVSLAGGLARWLIETGGDVSQHRRYDFKLEDPATRLVVEIVVPVLYFGFATWLWNGRTPGKRLFKIRVVSLVHRRMSLWHSAERALGYGAAALEFGFGFVQFFIHPYRRTVQDRIAETIVVKEGPYRARFSEREKT